MKIKKSWDIYEKMLVRQKGSLRQSVADTQWPRSIIPQNPYITLSSVIPQDHLLALCTPCRYSHNPLCVSLGQIVQSGISCYIAWSLHAVWVKHCWGCIIGYFMLLHSIAWYCRVLSGHWAGCIIVRQFRQLALPQARKEKTRPLHSRGSPSNLTYTLSFSLYLNTCNVFTLSFIFIILRQIFPSKI